MKGAKELAALMRSVADVMGAEPEAVDYLDAAAHLDAKAAIDSAVSGEVGEIIERHATMQGALHHLGATNADTFPAIREHRDRGILLAIVQRQAGEMALVTAERDSARMDRRDLAAKVEQLTDRLRIMQHGETEAPKMMAAENLLAATEGICATVQLDLLTRLANLRAVLLTGKGEATVPACVVRRILKNWSGLWDGWTLRLVDLRAYALRSPDGSYTYCATAEEFMEHLDAAGNGLLP